MSELVKELSALLYHLDNLYYETKDPAARDEIELYFERMGKQLELAVKAKFDENNALYIELTDHFGKTDKELKQAADSLAKLPFLFKKITDLLNKLDDLLRLFKRKNKRKTKTP
jgi:hypothetical protein